MLACVNKAVLTQPGCPKIVVENIKFIKYIVNKYILLIFLCILYLDANPCERTPCKNGGTCIPRGALYQCNCLHGYGGLNCDGESF